MDTPPAKATGLEFLARYSGRPSLGTAKYAQLRATLLAAIESGYWKPGTKLPTEQELVRTTPYSLGTVQRALRALVDEGIVVRVQGSGTYVADGRKPMDQPWHCRFLDDSGRGFLPIYPRVVSRKRTRDHGPWSDHVARDGGDVIRIDRVIDVNGEFQVYSKFYVNAARFASLLTRPAAGLDGANLKILISREFSLPVTHVSQTMSTVRFPEAVQRALRLRRAVTGTLLEIAASAGRDRPLYYQELYIPPNRRRLVMSDTVPGQSIPVRSWMK